jgi:hypothetical protein
MAKLLALEQTNEQTNKMDFTANTMACCKHLKAWLHTMHQNLLASKGRQEREVLKSGVTTK